MNIIATLGKLDKAPSEFQVFPYGQFELEGPEITKVLVDQESMNTIISEFNRRGNDLVIDYEHQSIKDDQAPAAGWITSLMNRGKDGLWAAVNWTQRAKNYLKNREYRYFSPVFNIRRADHKVIKILNVALTNNPRINRINPIIAKADYLFICKDQRRLNEMMGISDEDFLEYSGKIPEPVKLFETFESEEKRIQEMMGVSDEDLLKYSGQ